MDFGRTPVADLAQADLHRLLVERGLIAVMRARS